MTKRKANTPEAGATIEAPAKVSKLGILESKLRAGATLAQLVEATGWQAHSVRGAMSGSLKKKRGLDIASEKIGDDRVYRIVGGTAA